MKTIQKFKKNDQGRDFVVGDLHGQYNKFLKLLEVIKFDRTKDRMFSVGDLIDRGTQCDEVLKLLWEPWFFPCQGNHDLMLVDYITTGGDDRSAQWYLNGGGWFLNRIVHGIMPAEKLAFYGSCSDKIEQLPLGMEIQLSDRTIGVCHAEPPLNWAEVYTKPYEELYGLMTWSRSYIRGRNIKIKNIDKVYCGHTIVEEPLHIHNVVFIDTGAYRKAESYLTCYELETEVAYRVNE